MNLRQQVTAGAREFDADTTPTCPHLSSDPHVKGKQIRAVAINRMFDPENELEIPCIDLSFSPYTSLNDLSREAASFLSEHIEGVLEELEEDEDSPAAIYLAGIQEEYESDAEQHPESSSPVSDTMDDIRVFINSAVAFTADNIYMFSLANREIVARRNLQ